jgi:hypothetical protein
MGKLYVELLCEYILPQIKIVALENKNSLKGKILKDELAIRDENLLTIGN